MRSPRRSGAAKRMAGFVTVGTLSQVPEGEVRVFHANGKSIAVAMVDGTVYAVDNVCTHDGGPLGEGEVVDHMVECPRHGARFDLETGRVRALPAVLPIKTYPVQVVGDEIKVEIA